MHKSINPDNPVYIIDDSQIDTYILRRFIMNHGQFKKVKEFEFAQQALNSINKNLQENNFEDYPHIIFLDINMPDMNGFEFLEKLENFPESLTENIVVIIVSSSDDPYDLQIAKSQTSIKHYLKKPVVESDVKSLLDNFICVK